MVFLMGLFGQMSGNGLGYFNVRVFTSSSGSSYYPTHFVR